MHSVALEKFPSLLHRVNFRAAYKVVMDLCACSAAVAQQSCGSNSSSVHVPQRRDTARHGATRDPSDARPCHLLLRGLVRHFVSE